MMLVSTLAVAIAAAAVQSRPPQGRPDAPDIVVEAEPEPLPARPGDRLPFGVDTSKSIDTFDHATRAARCATNRRIADPALFREAVDGVFNSNRHDHAVAMLIRVTRACGEGAQAPDLRVTYEQTVNLMSIDFGALGSLSSALGPARRGTASTTERGILYRGAFIVAALRTYAPDLKLTRAMLRDPDVRRRMAARELPRIGQRVPADRQYAVVAMCLVEHDPESAQRLVASDPLSVGPRRLAARLIANGRDCVGGRRVLFNPSQLRVYVAEAVYRWGVAVRGVDSLIPSQETTPVAAGG